MQKPTDVHNAGAFVRAADDDYRLTEEDKVVLSFIANSDKNDIVIDINGLQIPVESLLPNATGCKEWISLEDGWVFGDVSIL